MRELDAYLHVAWRKSAGSRHEAAKGLLGRVIPEPKACGGDPPLGGDGRCLDDDH